MNIQLVSTALVVAIWLPAENPGSPHLCPWAKPKSWCNSTGNAVPATLYANERFWPGGPIWVLGMVFTRRIQAVHQPQKKLMVIHLILWLVVETIPIQKIGHIKQMHYSSIYDENKKCSHRCQHRPEFIHPIMPFIDTSVQLFHVSNGFYHGQVSCRLHRISTLVWFALSSQCHVPNSQRLPPKDHSTLPYSPCFLKILWL